MKKITKGKMFLLTIIGKYKNLKTKEGYVAYKHPTLGT